jgi:hypothetical protein
VDAAAANAATAAGRTDDTPTAPSEPKPYDGNKIIFMDVSGNQLVGSNIYSTV